MADVRFVLSRNPQRLFEAAADGFLQQQKGTPDRPFPSPSYVLALRQGGLRDDLIRLAAERAVPGWFDPPLCIFGELPRWLGASDLKQCDDVERIVLLERILAEAAPKIIGRPEVVDAIDRFFGELIAEGITAEALGTAFERIPERDSFQKQRDTELLKAYSSMQSEMAALGWRDGRATFADTAAAIADTPDRTSRLLKGRREIRIYGLHDLRGGWRLLISALAGCPALDRIAIYAASELPLELDAQVERLDEPDSLANVVFTDRAAVDAPKVSWLQAPDPAREVEEVARRLRTLIDEGVRPARIAIVARQARPRVNAAVDALDRFGVPVVARMRTSVLEIASVRAVLRLVDAAAQGWTRHALVELAAEPYIGVDLDSVVINFAGYRERIAGLDDWTDAFERLYADAVAEEKKARDDEQAGRDVRRSIRIPSDRIKRAADKFEAFRARVEELNSRRSLSEWLDWLDRAVREDAWQLRSRVYQVPAGEFRLARLDLAGVRTLEQLVASWRKAVDKLEAGSGQLDPSDFAVLLRTQLDTEVAIWTERRAGVNALESLAAAYRSFDHVFILGMESGEFPRRRGRSPILDDEERAALIAAGLPLDAPANFTSREQELFRVLIGGAATSLTLSYAARNAQEGENAPSAYLEAVADAMGVELRDVMETIEPSRVLTPGLPLVTDREVVTQAIRAARMERVRQTGRRSVYNGMITDPTLLQWVGERFGESRQWSPTQLEAFAKCGFAYFAERLLYVERVEEPDDEMAATTRGTLFHRVLQRFYETAMARDAGQPVFLRESDRAWAAKEIGRSLEAELRAAQGEFWFGAEPLREVAHDELLRTLTEYIEWEIEYNEDSWNTRTKASKNIRTGVVQHERSFDNLAFDVDGVRFLLRGSIDRVERGVDERIPGSEAYVAAVDYKSSTWSTPAGGKKDGWQDGVVLQVPLYVKALEKLEPGSIPARIEYRAIKQREIVHPLQLYSFTKKGGLTGNEADLERLEEALNDAAGVVRRARAAEFAARYVDSCKCPSFCAAWDICRVKGGPQDPFGW